MFVVERQRRIIDLIKEKGGAQVDELSQILGVSPMTIRRDLISLQNQGQIERTHGGAIGREEITYADKRVANKNEKKLLALKCKSLVTPGNTVFLDAGTTMLEIAKLIKNVGNLMVVTTDIEIVRYLMKSEVDIILCGGKVQKSTGSILGNYALQMIADFRFDVGFFGAAIINEEGEVMTPTVEKAFLKRETAKRCEKTYLVVDKSKFQNQAMVKINTLHDYTEIITDYEFTKDEREQLL